MYKELLKNYRKLNYIVPLRETPSQNGAVIFVLKYSILQYLDLREPMIFCLDKTIKIEFD
jgi:hypothetical protein